MTGETEADHEADGAQSNAGQMPHHQRQSVHACWVARAIRVPSRACVRESAAETRCGGLASHRVLGERGQLAHHGGPQKWLFRDVALEIAL